MLVAGGHITLVGPLNSFVHAVMYSYYYVTATWPEYKQNVWWKKYITLLQIVRRVTTLDSKDTRRVRLHAS
jgi:hypothetical protein